MLLFNVSALTTQRGFKNTEEKRLTPKGAEGKGAKWGVNFRGEDEEAATSGTVPAFRIDLNKKNKPDTIIFIWA